MPPTRTILWHDYETSGRSARVDRPLQFAAIRTDEDLNEVGEPISLRARLGEDVLPEPEACLVTNVVPGDHADEEVSELAFAKKVLATLEEPGTCSVGYNSVRFDEEFTRFMLWRCLLPVYDREWRNGNSKWDLLDVMRATCALRPEGLEWPQHDDGRPSFKLTHLAVANGLSDANAHDALADVRMTIELARLVRDRQPKLYQFLYEYRTKKHAQGLIDHARANGTGLVHVNGRFGNQFCCTSLLSPVCEQQGRKGTTIAVDLRWDPEPLLELEPEQLREWRHTRRDKLPEEAVRVGVETIAANKAPVLASQGALDEGDAWDRIQLDRETVAQRLLWVQEHQQQLDPVLQFLVQRDSDGDPDPECSLYGGFVGDRDARISQQAHRQDPSQWRDLEAQFQDERLRELLFRLRCREHPETLDDDERSRWREHLTQRLLTPLEANDSRLDATRRDLERLRSEREDDSDALALLDRVEALVDSRVAALVDA